MAESRPPAAEAPEPTDPDVDLHVPAQRRELGRGQRSLLAVIACGGALGAAARYGASLVWPTPGGGFPWTTFGVNVAGCALIGVLMVAITEVRSAHRLLRPFFATGVLGGFTTFSTYAVDVQTLAAGGRTRTALAYLVATPLGALAAVAAGVWCARRVHRAHHRHRTRRDRRDRRTRRVLPRRGPERGGEETR